jgi:hypothetical protein
MFIFILVIIYVIAKPALAIHVTGTSAMHLAE